MVISYNVEQLLAIGEKVTLEGLLAGSRNYEVVERDRDVYDCSQQCQPGNVDITERIQQICKMDYQKLMDQGEKSPDSTSEGLTDSVAEFFRKAQQNFYAQTSIDPTKVKSLSEIEAELINQRGSS